VHIPQFDTAELYITGAFENISDIPLMQLGVDETNRHMLSKKVQEVSILSCFPLGLSSGKML
jgi:hypothetical protein